MKLLVISILTLWSSFVLADQPVTSTVEEPVSAFIPTEGLSLPIPREWSQVPPSTIDHVTMKLRQRLPNARINRPIAAFQKSPLVSDELVYPYILVYKFPSRPPSKSELRAMTTQALSQHVSDEARASTDGFVTFNPTFTFDEDSSRVKGAFMSKVGEIGDVSNYVEIIPVRDGTVSLNGYLLGETPEIAKQFFGPVFGLASLDGAHSYMTLEKNQSLYIPFDWSKALSAALVGAAIAAIFSRKKKQN